MSRITIILADKKLYFMFIYLEMFPVACSIKNKFVVSNKIRTLNIFTHPLQKK
jgi:hypothetical protein